MRTYIRWIQWNGKMAVNHPVRFALAWLTFSVVCQGFTWWAQNESRKLQRELAEGQALLAQPLPRVPSWGEMSRDRDANGVLN